MSVAALCLVLAAACALLALVLNHIYARLALVELTLNEGLPPGYEATTHELGAGAREVSHTEIAALLAPGVHIFASRNCHACQRLLDELDQVVLTIGSDFHLHYVDRPRPIAQAVADRHGATLHPNQAEVAQRAGADPLPYTIVVGPESLVSRSVSPTVAQVLETARNAGVRATAQATA